jgi:DNA polymerase-3 subunit alpha
MLGFEKQLLGFYFSGHPMDEFRKLWERSSTLDLSHPERATNERDYIVVGQLREFREIITKSGRKMAFGLIEDYSGTLEIVFFADVLERLRPQLEVDRVLFLKGKFDATRGKPSLKVEDLVDPATLREKSWRELHIRLTEVSNETGLLELRDALYSLHGSCALYLHVPCPGGETVIRASPQITCSALDGDMEFLRDQNCVTEVWRD